MKDVLRMGSSKADWDAFPESVKDEAGYQLDRIQRGAAPGDWKPMKNIGSGVCELRIRDAAGAFRVICIATQPEGIYILHAFQKKTQTTSLHDIRLAQDRFKNIQR